MTPSDRSKHPKRPSRGPGRSGRTPSSPAAPGKPGAPPRHARGRPGQAPGGPTAARPLPRAKAPQPARAPPAHRPAARNAHKAGRAARAARPTQGGKPENRERATRRRKADTRRTAAKATNGTPGELRIKKRPFWQSALLWLKEDPDKGTRKSNRERAARQVEAENEARRKAYLKDTLTKAKLGFVAGVVTGDGKGGPPADAAPGAAVDAEPAQPAGLRGFFHKMLGERQATDEDGDEVILPPEETDWRWKLHRFFRSNSRMMAYLRFTILFLVIVSTLWVSVLGFTGYNLADYMDPVDPEDPRTQYRLPFFIIESGSMMHHDAAFGRLGTIDPGDLVILQKMTNDTEIQTFYGKGDREVAGAKGDVIMFLPVPTPGGDQNPDPIIHRPMAYLLREEIVIPHPDPGPNKPATVQVPRFTVEEFGIYQASAVNIPELGLRNYRPDASGYITRGDNQRSNNWADQALGVTPNPVPRDRILGTLRGEVPYIGLAKIALQGQDPALISADAQWCSFLAGQAACDTWVVFFALVIVFVGLPLVITTIVFTRRLYVRYLDRAALRRQQEEELRRLEAERALRADAGSEATPLRPFDATDLLTGRVSVGGAPGAGGSSWRTPRGGAVSWQDDATGGGA